MLLQALSKITSSCARVLTPCWAGSPNRFAVHLGEAGLRCQRVGVHYQRQTIDSRWREITTGEDGLDPESLCQV
jgi:hypothetical protein